MSGVEQELARQVLMHLVQPGDTTADTRRWASRQELDEDGWMLVHKLADSRLVVTDRTAHGQDQAALVHEALILHWERLHEWLEENRVFHQWQHHRLWPLLRQWEATDSDDSALLRGVLLAEAEEFGRAHSADLSHREHVFIEASLAERNRRQTELEKTRRRKREQAQVTLSRQLAAQAVVMSNTKLDVALLLTLESLRFSFHGTDRTAMYASFSISPLLSNIFHGPVEAIHRLTFDRDRIALFSAGEFGNILRWDLACGRPNGSLLPADAIPPGAHFCGYSSIEFSPDGRLLCVAKGRKLAVWDLVRSQVLFSEAEAHSSDIYEAFFTADGSRLLTRDEQENLKLWHTGESALGASRLLASPATVDASTTRAMSPAGDKLARCLNPERTSILL